MIRKLPPWAARRIARKCDAKKIAAFKAKPDRANAEERVGFVRQVKRGNRLVSADIQRPDDYRSLIHCLLKVAQGGELLVFVRDIASIEKMELGAKESDPSAPLFKASCGLRSVVDIG